MVRLSYLLNMNSHQNLKILILKKLLWQFIKIQDEHRKNEWKLKERQRPHEPFDDETLSEIEIQRNEYAAQVAAVYNAQG